MKNVKAKLVLQVGKSLGAEIGWKRSVDQQRARTKRRQAVIRDSEIDISSEAEQHWFRLRFFDAVYVKSFE